MMGTVSLNRLELLQAIEHTKFLSEQEAVKGFLVRAFKTVLYLEASAPGLGRISVQLKKVRGSCRKVLGVGTQQLREALEQFTEETVTLCFDEEIDWPSVIVKDEMREHFLPGVRLS